VTATPLWFGPDERPLFGWLHLPDDGRARAAVVLCPPLGIEAICSYFSYRTLAEELAKRGIAAFRFDYDGTGDSAGSQEDTDRVAAWQDSVRRAVDLVSGLALGPIALLGMRMGALMAAAEAERRGGVDALVLWDPCLSGSSFLREQRAFLKLSLGGAEPPDGSVEAPGMAFDRATVDKLSGLDLLKTNGRLAARCLVLEHPDRPRSRRLVARLADTDAEFAEAVGQEALLDPPRQETPHATLDMIATWLSDALPASEPVAIIAPGHRHAVIGTGERGEDLVERPIELGPQRLFGIITEPKGARRGPTIVFVNEGSTPHIGQSRMWVELARRWARAGLRVARWDLSGNGDSPARAGRQSHMMGAPEHFDDVVDVMRALSPGDPSNVVLVGLCAGAYQSLDVAMALPPRGLCLVNPGLSLPVPEYPVDPRRRARQATRPWLVRCGRPLLAVAARRRSARDAERLVQAVENGTWPYSLARRLPRVPSWVWGAVIRLCLTNRSTTVFDEITRNGVDVYVVCAAEDAVPIELGAERALARLQRRPNFTFDVQRGLDHAGLRIEERRLVMDAFTEHILSRFGPHALPDPPALHGQSGGVEHRAGKEERPGQQQPPVEVPRFG
jgi:alpha-beta hydrolase superfamily lysophospholipase